MRVVRGERRANRRRIINLLMTVLVVVVLALTGAVAFSAWQQYRASHADDNTAIVTASMKDDQAAHTILIPGEDGQRSCTPPTRSSAALQPSSSPITPGTKTWTWSPMRP